MKTTVNGIIIQLTEEQKAFLNDLMNRYCAAIRWSFKRLLDGWKTQEIRLGVQGRFKLNSRQANDAVYDAQATISSQKELLKLNYANATKKVEFTQKRLDKANSPKKKANLQKRLDKEQRKLACWQKHLDAGTFPTVVFGTISSNAAKVTLPMKSGRMHGITDTCPGATKQKAATLTPGYLPKTATSTWT